MVMWNPERPIRRDWPFRRIEPLDTLYEWDGPVIFTAEIGLYTHLFFKKDELEAGECFIGCMVDEPELHALKDGRLSVRGIFISKTGWLLQLDFNLDVLAFQELSIDDLAALLPPRGVGLFAGAGLVPDSLDQAESLMAFKFYSQAMSNKAMPLSVFRELVDGVANFVRSTLTPTSLLGSGRDHRFFDVEIGEPEFASLLIPIRAATLDETGLREFWRTQDLSPQELRRESEERGQVLWDSLVRTSEIAQKGALDSDEISENHALLRDLAALVPSEDNEIERLEVSYRRKERTEIVILDKKAGDRLLKAQEAIEDSVITINGAITEINGDSKTFRIKDIGEYLTTCSPTTAVFDHMDKNGLLQRGQKLAVTGRYSRRKRLGFMTVNEYPKPL
jgi:hypothetical protein